MRWAAVVLGVLMGGSQIAWCSNNADLEIYEDYPIGAWSDWSWASHEVQSPIASVPGALPWYLQDLVFEKAIKADLAQWTAVRLHHAEGINATAYSELEFWVHGGTVGNQQFVVHVAMDDNGDGEIRPNEERPPVWVGNYVTPVANEWRQVRIPLADLRADQLTALSDIYFREWGGSSVPTVWIDHVVLLKKSSSSSGYIEVNAGSTVGRAQKLHFGINTAVWDSSLNSVGTIARLKEGGMVFLRFPGGSTADEFDWLANSNKRTGERYKTQTFGTNTDDFLAVANAAGAEKFITINYGSGIPTEARDWLREVNVVKQGKVLYWGIGNEPFGSWEYDTHPRPHDAVTYAQLVRDTVPLMKAVDPFVRIGVAGTFSERDFEQCRPGNPLDCQVVINPRTGQPAKGWSAVMLSTLAGLHVTPGFYEVHYYPTDAWHEADAHLFQSSNGWADRIAAARQMLRDYLGPSGASIPIFIAENNSVANQPGKQTTNMSNALYLMDSMLQATIAGGSSFMWWNLHNGAEVTNNNSVTLPGNRLYGDYGVLSAGSPEPLNAPYPTFRAFQLLKQFVRPTERLVAVSSSPLLRAYASKSNDGRKVRVLIMHLGKLGPPWLNRGYPISTLIRFSGFRPDKCVRAASLPYYNDVGDVTLSAPVCGGSSSPAPWFSDSDYFITIGTGTAYLYEFTGQ